MRFSTLLKLHKTILAVRSTYRLGTYAFVYINSRSSSISMRKYLLAHMHLCNTTILAPVLAQQKKIELPPFPAKTSVSGCISSDPCPTACLCSRPASDEYAQVKSVTQEPEEFLEERKIALHRYLQKVLDGTREIRLGNIFGFACIVLTFNSIILTSVHVVTGDAHQRNHVSATIGRAFRYGRRRGSCIAVLVRYPFSLLGRARARNVLVAV